MSNHLKTQMPVRFPLPEIARKKTGFFNRFITALVMRRRRRIQIDALERLDDRLLEDIGISRNEIAQVAAGFDPRDFQVVTFQTPIAAQERPHNRRRRAA